MERKFVYEDGKFHQAEVTNQYSNNVIKNPSSYFGETINKVQKLELYLNQNYLPSKILNWVIKFFSVLLFLIMVSIGLRIYFSNDNGLALSHKLSKLIYSDSFVWKCGIVGKEIACQKVLIDDIQ